MPLIPGHEVDEVGTEVTRAKRGDRVATTQCYHGEQAFKRPISRSATISAAQHTVNRTVFD